MSRPSQLYYTRHSYNKPNQNVTATWLASKGTSPSTHQQITSQRHSNHVPVEEEENKLKITQQQETRKDPSREMAYVANIKEGEYRRNGASADARSRRRATGSLKNVGFFDAAWRWISNVHFWLLDMGGCCIARSVHVKTGFCPIPILKKIGQGSSKQHCIRLYRLQHTDTGPVSSRHIKTTLSIYRHVFIDAEKSPLNNPLHLPYHLLLPGICTYT